MRLSHLLSLSLLLCAAARTGAQLAPADDFFHRGAQSYLSNNIPAAQALVDAGLKLYPADEHLKKLDELLKQKQQDQQKNQDPQQQDQKDQQNQKSEEQKKQDQPKPQEDPQKGDPKKDEPSHQPEPQKPSPEKKEGEKPEDQKGDGQPQALQPMTPEEAKRLLDAQKNGEQVLQLKPPEKPQDRRPPAKDW
jgi:hypothetical protein